MGTTRLAVRVGYQLLDLFWSLLEILTSITLSALLLPLFAVLWLFNEGARLVVRALLLYDHWKTTTGSRTRLISNGVDGIWSYEKPGNSRNVLIVYVYDRPLDLADFRSKYLHRIVLQPEYAKLRKIFVKRYGYFCWKEPGPDAPFDIAKHVKNVNVPDSARGCEDYESPVTETQLNTIILPALAKDMDEDKPQWEELIIPDFRYDSEAEEDAGAQKVPRRSARIYRSHHAYMDGGSTLMLCANMYSPDNDTGTDTADGAPVCCTAPTFPYMVNPLAPPKVPAWRQALYKFNCALLGLTTVGKILYEASQIRSRFLTPGPYSGRHHFSLSRPIKLSMLKEIKEVTHTSLPTILSSVIGASVQALDQRLSAGGSEGVNDARSPNSIPIGLVGAILPYPSHKPRNRFTVVNFRVSTALRRTKLENLSATQRSMSTLATSPNGYINYVLFRIFGKCPAFVLQFMMRKGCTPIIYSNTPWASERVKLWGTPVENVFGWMPLLTTAGKIFVFFS